MEDSYKYHQLIYIIIFKEKDKESISLLYSDAKNKNLFC